MPIAYPPKARSRLSTPAQPPVTNFPDNTELDINSQSFYKDVYFSSVVCILAKYFVLGRSMVMPLNLNTIIHFTAYSLHNILDKYRKGIS